MNKKFLIILILAIVVLSTNVWAIPDPCSNKEDGADCGENFPCCTCYNETSKYNETQDNDCDDLVEIDTCIWDPDDNPFTLDYHAPVEGFCVSLFTCSNPTYGKFTHTCDITNCDAECELDDNCEPYMEEEGPVFRLLEDVKRPSTGSVCNYAGFCDSCECDYEEDWCPEPGFEEQEGERDSSWPICYYDVTCESDG
ncbi:MAG: hypothetical protein KAQ83_02815, partial [Nanoarchaeota archaeon]|nr:hypothetical protein [Nanoarchaeota archaeon]